jgi:glycosyltransferase involved in cell wall biosynthesis
VPSRENHGGVLVDHPRFPVIPKLCKAADAPLLAAALLNHVSALRREFPFDVIDSHWAYPDGAAAAMLARRLRVPLAITVRGDDVNVFLNKLSRRHWIRWSLGKADLVIALSSELKDIVVANGVSPSKVAVIPNGINPQQFHPIERRAARARLGLPAGRRVVLSAGRLHRSKGFPILVAALGLLASGFDDVHAYIVGPPDHEADTRPEIEKAAARYGLQQRLHLIGAQDPAIMKYWYSAADVFCLPTAREGSANVLLEAMACGLPCITTPVGGNPDVVNDEEVGMLVPRDAESLSRALGLALSRHWDAARISQRASRRTWQVVATECRNRLSAIARHASRALP